MRCNRKLKGLAALALIVRSGAAVLFPTYYSVNRVFQCIHSPQKSTQERGGKEAYSLLCAPAATSAVEPKIDNFVNTILSLFDDEDQIINLRVVLDLFDRERPVVEQ